MSPPLLADLHLHSHHSDGLLTPEALIELCASRGVTLAALTDHDTLAGCESARLACDRHGLRHVTGVEVSCGWNGQTLHVIGLDFDPAHAELTAHLSHIRARRADRPAEIGERLERKASIAARPLVTRILGETDVPTRMHLARSLIAAGHARDLSEAFDLWLSRGTPGHVPEEWPALAVTVAALRAAGARVALTHPHRYRLSGGALRRLLGEFREAGGEAIEVSVAGIGPSDLDRLATLARNLGFTASTGSDFHDPAVPWNPPGRFAKLPHDLEPLAARLG
ncbi:MAG: PHP domain-containing protein [Gammaproteobacteria bacterium]|nr:PHP domain-containing protein [Gammaproteobacteria bacterium]